MTDVLDVISKGNPGGYDIRHTSEFDMLKQLRQEEDRSVSYDVWARPLKSANWDVLKEKTTAVLQTKSKDFQILIWLTECFDRNFEGIAEGLSLINQFLKKFFDYFHPLDEMTRVSLFEWMERVYVDHILQISLKNDEVLTLDKWRLIQATKEQSLDALRKKLNFVSDEAIERMKKAVTVSLDDIKEIKTFLNFRIKDAPTFQDLIGCLRELIGIFDYRLEHKPVLLSLETSTMDPISLGERDEITVQNTVEEEEELYKDKDSREAELLEKIDNLAKLLAKENYIFAGEQIKLISQIIRKYGRDAAPS